MRGESPSRISCRQADVWEFLALGMTNKMIARRLGVSENTVKTHINQLYPRLGVHSRTQAALLWGKAA